jgi:cytochrome P450
MEPPVAPERTPDAKSTVRMRDRQAPPSPDIAPRDLLRAFREDPIALVERIAAECGDIACLDLGSFKVFVVNHPDLVKDVLVTHQSVFVKGEVFEGARRLLGDGLLTSEGELHRRQRRLIQPVFQHNRLNDHVAAIVARAEAASARWRDGEVVNVSQEMVDLTMSLLGEAVFGSDAASQEASRTALAGVLALSLFGRLASPFARLLEQIQTERAKQFEEIATSFDDTVVRMIAERRATGLQGTDLLSRLLQARDEEAGEGMSDELVRDEILTFLIAGHETWSNSLGWTWYVLSENPEAREKLHAELDAELGDRVPTIDDVRRLRYADMVYSEALRLYPPVWALGRTAVVDHELAGYPVPRGSIVLFSQYVVHRDPRWFPDPLRFDPERWEAERARSVPVFAYFPFGAGNRVCIGQPLAKLGGILVLATIARRWRLDLVPGHVARGTAPLMRPEGGLPMTATRRSDRPATTAPTAGGAR